MAQADIPFPATSNPGQKPGEGQGRLVNAFCEMDGGLKTWRPVPGLSLFSSILSGTTPVTNTRGMFVNGTQLYVVQDEKVFTISKGGFVQELTYTTALAGDLPGSDPVTIATNNKSPTRDMIIVTDLGVYTVDNGVVEDLSAPNLPAVNSVCSLDGFFLYTTQDGKIYASELNDTAVEALSFATAESNPDGLLRGTVHGNQFFAFGPNSIEVFQNVGASPFPLQRVAVIPVGLLGAWAVAGNENGWPDDQLFVATDCTVRRLKGYDPVVVSNKDVERAIANVFDKTTIKAFVYVAEGNPIWSLSSDNWTWEYNCATGFWHERKTAGLNRWLGESSVYFGDKWLISRKDSERLLYVDKNSSKDDETSISMTIESGPVKDFPSRVYVAAAFFDWSTGNAPLNGPFDTSDPEISISWSHDGGGIWSNEYIASSLGRTGRYVESIRVNRVGLASRNGMKFRLMTTSPVYKTFRGGRCEFQIRGPA